MFVCASFFLKLSNTSLGLGISTEDFLIESSMLSTIYSLHRVIKGKIGLLFVGVVEIDRFYFFLGEYLSHIFFKQNLLVKII